MLVNWPSRLAKMLDVMLAFAWQPWTQPWFESSPGFQAVFAVASSAAPAVEVSPRSALARPHRRR